MWDEVDCMGWVCRSLFWFLCYCFLFLKCVTIRIIVFGSKYWFSSIRPEFRPVRRGVRVEVHE